MCWLSGKTIFPLPEYCSQQSVPPFSTRIIAESVSFKNTWKIHFMLIPKINIVGIVAWIISHELRADWWNSLPSVSVHRRTLITRQSFYRANDATSVDDDWSERGEWHLIESFRPSGFLLYSNFCHACDVVVAVVVVFFRRKLFFFRISFSYFRQKISISGSLNQFQHNDCVSLFP